MVAVAAASLSGGACTKPQSGLFAAIWCSTDAGANVQVLDDMEDDDGKACAGQGAWSVVKGDGSGQTTPPQGSIMKTADLLDVDLAVRPGRRALHLEGTGFGDGETAALRLDLADGDLTPYIEVQFWARSDTAAALDFRVAVPTETTADNGGVYWGLPVTVTQKWGDGEGKAFSFPLQGTGDTMVPDDQKDLDHALGLEFQVRANADTSSFGVWIDDVVLIRHP
ncbi:MAG: hypothetical protein QOI66_3764 [Myxococcales bacterium]|jgi:hypothetical protein|nr:hypothetical protein [Myxococcales bacterium]